MSASYRYCCNICGHNVRTEGPWEFYRDAEGARRLWGHPFPVSGEAERAGVAGFLGEVYCPVCDTVRRMVLVEFVEPLKGSTPRAQRGQPKPEYSQRPRCRGCGGEVLLEPPEDGVPCPRCLDGVLMGYVEWIS